MSNESDGIKKSKIKKQSDGINCQVAFCRNKHFKGSNISFFRFLERPIYGHFHSIEPNSSRTCHI